MLTLHFSDKSVDPSDSTWTKESITRTYLMALRNLGIKSPTARKLIDEVHRSSTTIYVMPMPIDGCFGASAVASGGPDGPTIIWSPGASFVIKKGFAFTDSYYGSGALKFDAKTGQNDVEYKPELILAHEIGHAKQYLEDAARFRTIGAEGTWSTDQIEADNLKRHEWPIANEYGLNVRTKYSAESSFHSKPVVSTIVQAAVA